MISRRGGSIGGLVILALLAGCGGREKTEAPEAAATPTAPGPALASPPREDADRILPPPRVEPPARAETLFQAETAYPAAVARPPRAAATILPVGMTPARIERDGTTVEGMILTPEGFEPLGAALLLPPWWGITDEVLAEARRIAGWGYLVLVHDRDPGPRPQTRREAHERMSALDADAMLAEMRAAVGWLAEEASTRTQRCVVLGYDRGASEALRLAAVEPRVAGLVLFNPEIRRDAEALAAIKVPVLAFFAMYGGWTTPEQVEFFTGTLNARGTKPEVYRYTADPGFALNPENPGEEAYQSTARTRVEDFLGRALLQ